MNPADYSALDETLDLMAPMGPDLVNGFSNHAPMAIEAMCAMRRADAVMPWFEGYRGRWRRDVHGLRDLPMKAGVPRSAISDAPRIGSNSSATKSKNVRGPKCSTRGPRGSRPD